MGFQNSEIGSMEFSEFFQSKLSSPDKILQRSGRKVYFAATFLLELSYDPWFPICRPLTLKIFEISDFVDRAIWVCHRNFEDFSISGADISGTRGHMIKPRKRHPRNTLFFHPSEGFCQGIKV